MSGKRRRKAITKAVTQSLANTNNDNNTTDHDDARDKPLAKLAAGTRAIVSFFALHRLRLITFRPADFLTLRHESWHVDEDEYVASFKPPAATHSHGRDDTTLIPAGDLGYSGSTFFYTSNEKYLVKSLDRRFESSFFMDELFAPYATHMKAHADSLLIRITDTLYAPYPSLGTILGLQPRHFIVMENTLHAAHVPQEQPKWETYDLKPADYFFPERDIASGRLASQQVLDKLVDRFDDKVLLSSQWKQRLKDTIAQDTEFLAASNAIDYSLFFVRFPLHSNAMSDGQRERIAASATSSPSWRTGVVSTDGKWMYRAVLLDFLWAKHKLHARAMSALICLLNVLFHKGPMTITTEPYEYRTRFLRMVDELLA